MQWSGNTVTLGTCLSGWRDSMVHGSVIKNGYSEGDTHPQGWSVRPGLTQGYS